MSALAPKIYSALAGNEAVADLVATRIYPILMPQNAILPAITYTRVGSTPTIHLRGDSGLDSVRVQLDCWGATLSAADALATKVRAALFAATAFSVGGMNGPSDDYEPDTKYYRVTMDFIIWDCPGAGPEAADGGAWPAGAWPVGW